MRVILEAQRKETRQERRRTRRDRTVRCPRSRLLRANRHDSTWDLRSLPDFGLTQRQVRGVSDGGSNLKHNAR